MRRQYRKGAFELIAVCAVIVAVAAVRPLPAAAEQVTDKLAIGGFVIASYVNDSHRDTDYANVSQIFLYTDYRINPYAKGFFEVAYENVPQWAQGAGMGGANQGTVRLGRAYLEWNQTEAINFQAGKFLIPFGIWVPEHWRILEPTHEKVIHDQNMVVNHMPVGMKFFGSVPALGGRIEYAAHGSTGKDDYGSDQRTVDDWAGGAHLRYVGANFSIVGSYYDVDQLVTTGMMTERRNEKNWVIGGELALFDDRLNLAGEYVSQDRGNGDQGTVYPDFSSWYVSAEYDLSPKWAAYYRYEQGSDETRSGVQTNEANARTTVNAAALTWKPFPGFHVKGEGNFYDFTVASGQRDYNRYVVSTGLMF